MAEEAEIPVSLLTVALTADNAIQTQDVIQTQDLIEFE